MKKALLAKGLLVGVGTIAASIAGVHFGYKWITGECPCNIRRGLQFQLAMLLLKELEAEGYLELEEESDA